jgi:hypothetical protein
MPRLFDEIIISANYQSLTPKFPFALHELAGANVTMLKMLKENRVKLGIKAEAEHFDSTIAATLRMLQQKSVDMTLEAGDLNGDSAKFVVTLKNKAGHKFPSGYPSRRAWIEFEITGENGETLFHSGKLNPDYRIVGEDPNFEPHYNYIGDPNQVQIYEMTPGDVNGEFTNVLERGHRPIKDNRLTPRGFSIADPVYDTTEIIGSALNDPNFNRFDNGSEGSGSDALLYSIPLNGYAGLVSVKARIWYQSLPPKWIDPIFDWSAPEIDSFKTMYLAADKSPVLVAEQKLENLFVNSVSTKNSSLDWSVSVSPTISQNGQVLVSAMGNAVVKKLRVWDAEGKLVWEKNGQHPIQLPEKRGIYFIMIETNRGSRVEKVIRL